MSFYGVEETDLIFGVARHREAYREYHDLYQIRLRKSYRTSLTLGKRVAVGMTPPSSAPLEAPIHAPSRSVLAFSFDEIFMGSNAKHVSAERGLCHKDHDACIFALDAMRMMPRLLEANEAPGRERDVVALEDEPDHPSFRRSLPAVQIDRKRVDFPLLSFFTLHLIGEAVALDAREIAVVNHRIEGDDGCGHLRERLFSHATWTSSPEFWALTMRRKRCAQMNL